MPSLPSKKKIFVNTNKKLLKSKIELFRSALFHVKASVCLKYFVNDCSYIIIIIAAIFDYHYQPLTVFAKSSILGVRLGSEYTSELQLLTKYLL